MLHLTLIASPSPPLPKDEHARAHPHVRVARGLSQALLSGGCTARTTKRNENQFKNNPAAQEAATIHALWLKELAKLAKGNEVDTEQVPLTEEEVDVLARDMMNAPRPEFGGQRWAKRGPSSPCSCHLYTHYPPTLTLPACSPFAVY